MKMRASSTFAFLAAVASVAAVPITPAAPELQRRAEQFRLEGLKEWEIAEKVKLPLDSSSSPSTSPSTTPTTSTTTDNSPTNPFLSLTRLTSHLPSLFLPCALDAEDAPRDPSGDIAPGSLEAPQMLPRPAAAAARKDAGGLLERVLAVLRVEDAEGRSYAYEGKELELRRPTGMRHWGADDKWRLF